MYKIIRLLNNSYPAVNVLRKNLSVKCYKYAGHIFSGKNLRFYCNKIDKDPKAKESCRNKDDKVYLKPCKPINIDPTKSHQKEQEPPGSSSCKKSSICEKIPKRQPIPKEKPPDTPPEPPGIGRNIVIGVLITAATLGALYLGGFFDSQSEKSLVVSKKKDRKKRIIIKDPKNSSDIPNEVPYLLIGGGTASFSAFRAIKSADPTAKILIVSDEGYYPYMRPPLSKEMWYSEEADLVKDLKFKQWNGSQRNLYLEPDEFYTPCVELMTKENGGVAVARGYSVNKINVLKKTAILDDGYEIKYNKCLIATGATPRTLAVFEAASAQSEEIEDRVKLFRNIYDFQDVYESFNDSKSIAIIGGGFLGSELSCALARKSKKNKKIYQIFREGGVMGKILPEYLSAWTTEKVQNEGVEIINNSEVVGVKYNNKQMQLILNNGNNIKADIVIVAVGVECNTGLAKESFLEVDPELGGFVVNTELQARTDLYAAGDCACFYDPQLGRRRIEHFDQAVVSGRLAGENMTGTPKPYLHQSMFWSDLGPDVGYEAIGIVDASLPTVGVFAKATDQDTPKAVVTDTNESIRSKTEEKCELNNDNKNLLETSSDESKANDDQQKYGKGIIFYLRDDIVVGIVLWNVFNRMSVARQVIQDGKKYDDLNEVAKLFNIHEE